MNTPPAVGLLTMGTVFFFCRTLKMDNFLKMLLLLAMATMTIGVNPSPRIARGFTHQPTWGELGGDQIRQDCLQALTQFPQETEGLLAFTFARVFLFGSCALGVFVTHPDPSGINVVDDKWPNIWGWTKGSINLNTGAKRGGWEMNLQSGVQICFYEPAYVDKYRMCSMDTPYRRNHALTLANCLHIISPPRRGNLPPQPLPALDLNDPLRHLSGPRPSGTALPIMPTAGGSGSAGVEIGRYKSVPEWGGPIKIPRNDCKDAIKLFPDETLWDRPNSEFSMRLPEAYYVRRCAFGMFYIDPSDNAPGRKARAQGLEFHVEAFRLMLATADETPGGGFVNLRNGLQIVLYETDVVDPGMVCPHISSISLRACLDGMARYEARQAGEGSSSRQESNLQ